ncbi:GNAT family N-acetyltransferase [Brachyspira hyodysenteriae]|uniref:GNAT family N-acetyltransferase n=1 Tax=Brachyspira hyodysenteriae TaxID=159 RepID=UPI0022CD7CC1|nr:GNAT family N-acetyltransferase [Brachyspira hyodysenteriae]MCZ9852367.1 GNAT family N-acetyltransferase [Brachyspira hyodysenteriae]MCZ9861991.1 GNAT family N-acetyltransferase [Brachyspira hyodysenteriae]MCZ9869238.1 GNAT family N-acetyltransferase [Brachyspira hyodysenteriae]MCZ9877730.1 GNAT family N-acetyltransferase [Brachyspira hyodysenteriae]MCZ9894364.1 GNAT family N-acetyltransferase [Brachyspira hyodysenteriae]
MSDKKFSIRFATVEDIPTIMRFIKELAVYESLEHELNLTEESLKENIFEKKKAEVVIAFEDDIPVGHAVFFETFSTFVGRHGLYLDDLYVNEKYRGFGYGKKLFEEVAKIALNRNCGRLEWQCLDWNKSSIDFYLSTGAEMVKDARVYRLTNDALKKFLVF